MDEATGAFDAWLRNNLADRYGEALHEPIPPEMQALLGGQD